MYKVKGLFRNGVAFPEQPINGWDGEQVIITFVDKETAFESEPDVYPAMLPKRPCISPDRSQESPS
ncbi:MAG: hypothetical protein KBG20_15630 [Caldilineaceae bacterium]|nr:hypothetical protein [Caldilineaceae bacterium]MBP8110260.1 hypothetical protein [Caldilineaceae bacterium]MBP8123502.1 hypothetical protein [Caldilineaceae bacterium]MBP9073738.1 hypothetical protein [Caldilineaceae bacterium]